MVARSRRYVSRSNMHEQCRFVSSIYSTVWVANINNSGAQIPYLEKKLKQNDYRLKNISQVNITLETQSFIAFFS